VSNSVFSCTVFLYSNAPALRLQDGIATIISDKIRFADSLEFKARTVIIPAIRQASGGVLVTPGKGELELRGPKEDVANARDRLAAVATKSEAPPLVYTFTRQSLVLSVEGDLIPFNVLLT
jgi:hypothetical protein